MPTLDQLLAVLERSPDDAFILYGVAMEHAKLGDHDTALVYFDKAIEADATNPYHFFHKARSLETLGRIDEARVALTTGLAQARKSNDRQAIAEVSDYLDRMT